MSRGTWLSWIVSLYVASCALPAFGSLPGRPVWGILCLVLVPWVCSTPAWWANAFFFVGCCLLGGRHPRAARNCAVIAAMLAASFPLMYGPGILQIGSVVWLTSMGLLVVASSRRLGHPFKPGRVAALEDF